MAKRARGSTSRPGQRAPITRTPPRPATTNPAPRPPTDDIDLTEMALTAYEGNSLTDADLARAAELEAQIVAEEQSAGAAQQKARARSVAVPRATSTLAATAANEYAYVARDVRRIVLIGGSLIALLFGGWALIQVTGVGLF
jgi:hypothetical protein